MQTDERKGLPSASKFEIVACCNGQPQFEASLRDQWLLPDEKPDEMAERGTRIHKAYETGDLSCLAQDEREDLERLCSLSEETQRKWCFEKSLPEGTLALHKEQRLWLDDLASGQYDRLYIGGNHALVIDAKTGYCKRLSPSQQSWQLRLLAVLVWLEHGTEYSLETVRCAFIKPKLGRAAVDIVEYSVDDLMRANNAIRQILWQSQQPNAPRTAGDHCYYCRCKAMCPEASTYSLLPTVVAGTAAGMKRADVEACVQRLSPQDWAFIERRRLIAKTIFEATTKCLKSLSADDLGALGFEIAEGRRLDPITNVIGAYKALEHSLPPEKLWACLTISKTELVAQVQDHLKLTKKDAEKWVKERLQPFIEEKRADGSLVEKE